MIRKLFKLLKPSEIFLSAVASTPNKLSAPIAILHEAAVEFVFNNPCPIATLFVPEVRFARRSFPIATLLDPVTTPESTTLPKNTLLPPEVALVPAHFPRKTFSSPEFNALPASYPSAMLKQVSASEALPAFVPK